MHYSLSLLVCFPWEKFNYSIVTVYHGKLLGIISWN